MMRGTNPEIVRRADWFRSRPLLVLFAIFAISCGAPGTAPPVGTTLTVSAVAPSSLSTTGGVTVTIAGTGFGTDSAVTIDGVAMSGATVTATSITFTAPPHAAGASSFVVTSGAKTASGTVTFVAPSGANQAPTITNLRTIGSRNGQPSLFVDLNEEVQLIGTVSNVETTTTLTYAWTVGAGTISTISGTGAAVLWKLPAFLTTTPAPLAATLTVTETFTENSVQHRNVATASVLADAHDSQTEIMNKGFTFLEKFSQSSVPPSAVVADFATTCNGYQAELDDTIDIRNNYLHLEYTITRRPPVTFNFGRTCFYSAFGQNRNSPGDACSSFDVRWVVRALRDVEEDSGRILAGTVVTTTGRDFVTAVLRSSQWKLCDSQFAGSPTSLAVEPSGLSRMIPTPRSLSGRSGGIRNRLK